MSTTISPLIIACGTIPSTFLCSRDVDEVRVSYEFVERLDLMGRRRLSIVFPFVG